MGMLEPDWKDVSSRHADLRKMWEEVSFEPLAVHEPTIDECLAALRETRVHGGARVGCFHVSEHKVFDWFASRNLLVDIGPGDETGFVEHFFSLPALRSLLPEVEKAELPEDDMLDFPPVLEWGSSFTFDGEVAEKLVLGGCYKSFPGTPVEAVELARKFRNAIYGERYTDVQAYRSFDRWHEWFHYVEHSTWLLIDKRCRRIWLLCLTDTD